MKYNFIKTSDMETANILSALGFQKVDETNGIHTFLNCVNIQFSHKVDQKKITYSNVLCI